MATSDQHRGDGPPDQGRGQPGNPRPAPLSQLWRFLEGWLSPGLRIKRWAAVTLLGFLFLALGISLATETALSGPLLQAGRTMTFGPAHYTLRGVIFLALGLALFLLGVSGLYRALVGNVARAAGVPGDNWMRQVQQGQRLARGPHIVAIGGGTGLPVVLRGLKVYTSNLTAVVTVADDGGSSGRLRRELGVLPPGDFRNCLVALAETEPLMNDVMQYRFADGADLRDHAFGNLLLATLTKVTGNFELALEEAAKLLRVRGRILPSTLTNVTLVASTVTGEVIAGEAEIPKARHPIHMVRLDPAATAYKPAVQAILDADLVVLGPGSLYTSLMPNLLVPGIAQAIRRSKATTVFVCNVVMQPGETDSYSAEDHYQAVERHVGPGLVDFVLVNETPITVTPDGVPIRPVPVAGTALPGVTVVNAALVDPAVPTRHDSAKLAVALLDIARRPAGSGHSEARPATPVGRSAEEAGRHHSRR